MSSTSNESLLSREMLDEPDDASNPQLSLVSTVAWQLTRCSSINCGWCVGIVTADEQARHDGGKQGSGGGAGRAFEK